MIRRITDEELTVLVKDRLVSVIRSPRLLPQLGGDWQIVTFTPRPPSTVICTPDGNYLVPADAVRIVHKQPGQRHRLRCFGLHICAKLHSVDTLNIARLLLWEQATAMEESNQR